MAYDFPATPSNGQQYLGYTFDGEKWVGGFKAQGVSNAEQFFNLAGLANLDVQVPTWAVGVEIEGSLWTTAVGVFLRVSFDGTTFLAGASDYFYSGAQHSTGTNAFQGLASAALNGMYLSLSGDDPVFPHNVTAMMSLTKPTSTSSSVFILKTYAKLQNTLAAYLSRTYWGESWVSTSAQGANTAIKALRVVPNSGNFGTSSWVRFKWIGDLAAQPNGVSIVDAPSDGCEYVRVNNVWRLKQQTLVLDNLNPVDIIVPATAKLLRAEGMIWWASANAANSTSWRASVDGTNFMQGAADYFYGGLAHYNGSAGYANLVSANASFGCLTFASDQINHAARFRWLMPVAKPTTAANWTGTVNGGWFHSPAANQYTDFQFTSALQGVNAGGALRFQKLRFLNSGAAVNFGPGSVITCEWMY